MMFAISEHKIDMTANTIADRTGMEMLLKACEFADYFQEMFGIPSLQILIGSSNYNHRQIATNRCDAREEQPAVIESAGEEGWKRRMHCNEEGNELSMMEFVGGHENSEESEESQFPAVKFGGAEKGANRSKALERDQEMEVVGGEEGQMAGKGSDAWEDDGFSIMDFAGEAMFDSPSGCGTPTKTLTSVSGTAFCHCCNEVSNPRKSV
jgi:hypothetical protein